MPTTPLDVVALVITGGPTVTVIDRIAFPVPPPLVADRVTVDVPELVGVPESNPLLVFTDSHVGRPVAL